MTMNAAVLEDVGRLRLRRVRRPEPGPGEVVLKIEANTICGTDLRIISGAKTAGVRPGVILGHDSRDVSRPWAGASTVCPSERR